MDKSRNHADRLQRFRPGPSGERLLSKLLLVLLLVQQQYVVLSVAYHVTGESLTWAKRFFYGYAAALVVYVVVRVTISLVLRYQRDATAHASDIQEYYGEEVADATLQSENALAEWEAGS